MENWEDWKSQFLETITTLKFTNEQLNQFVSYSESIYNNGKIFDPFSSKTTDFLDNFIPALINKCTIIHPISSEISEAIGTVFQNISKLLARLIGTVHDLFISSASRIIILRDCEFYTATAKLSWIGTIEDRPYFNRCITAFKDGYPVTRIAELLESDKHVSFQYLCVIVDIFTYRTEELGNDSLQKVLNAVSNRLIKQNSSQSFDLRDIDESYVEPLFVKLFCNVKTQKTLDELKKMRFELYINFVKSDLIKKKLVGLENINESIEKEQIEVQDIAKYKILEDLLKDIPEQLIDEVCKLVAAFSRNNLTTHEHFTMLWSSVTKQSRYTVESYLSGIQTLLNDRENEKKNLEETFLTITESNTYNAEILKFMTAFAPKVSPKTRDLVYNALHSYISNKETVDNECIECLCAYLPTESNERVSLLRNFLSEASSGQRTLICLEVLCQLSPEMSNTDLNEYVSIILKEMTASQNRAHIITILSNTFIKRKEPMDKEMYEKITNGIYPLLSSAQENVSVFFSTLIKNEILSMELLQKLFLFYCTLEYVDISSLEVLILIYNKINIDPAKLVGMKELFSLYIKTGNKDLLTFIIEKHAITNSKAFTKDFVDLCFNEISYNSLYALLMYLYRTESGIDKAKLLFQENRVLTPNEMIRVTIIGDYSGDIGMPKEATFNSVIDYFANLFGAKRKDVKLLIKGEEIDPYQTNLEENVRVELKVSVKGTERQISKQDLPSYYVFDEKYRSILHSYLKSPDSEFYEISFKILEKIPTIKDELDIVNIADSFDDAFPKKNKFLCVYRLNAIARMIMANPEKTINDLIEKNFDIYIPKFVLTIAPEVFSDNLKYFIHLLEMLVLFVRNLKNKNKFSSFFYSNMTKLLDEYSTKNDKIVLIILNMIIEISPSEIFDESFLSFFSKVLLQTHQSVNKLLVNICKNVSPNIYIKQVIASIADSLYIEGSLVSQMLINVANGLEETEELWNALVAALAKFSPNEQLDFSKQLTFQVPCKSITIAIYGAMTVLLEKNEKLEKQKEVLTFLIEKVMFSTVRFYDINEKLFKLVSKIIAINREFSSIAMPYIKEAMQIKSDSDEINFSARSYQKKGLKNLGATCYMNSVLQMLFSIPEYRNAILSNNNYDDGTWEKELQNLFCALLFNPDMYESTEGFVKLWKGSDDEVVDVKEQKDASEFLIDFVDKASTSFKNTNGILNGEMSQKIVIESDNSVASETTQSFSTLLLDINNSTSVEECLEKFKDPQHIKYQTNDKKEVDALQYLTISKFPDYLALQLKRFEYDMQKYTRTKVNKQITFPHDLEIDSNKYKLHGIIVHKGTCQTGHYYSFIEEDNEWYEMNDITVNKVSEEYVMKMSVGSLNAKKAFDRKTMAYEVPNEANMTNAFILVYEKAVKECSMPQINSEILENAEKKTKNSIWQRIPAHRAFRNLYETVIQNDEEGDLAFSSFLNAITNEENPAKVSQLSESVLKACEKNENIRDGILTVDIYKKFVVNGLNENNKEEIVKIIRKSLENSSEEKKNQYIDDISLYILNDTYSFMSHWTTFKYCFVPFEVCPDATETEKKAAEELFFQAFDSYNSLNSVEKIYDYVHCDGLLAVISCFESKKIAQLFNKEKVLQLLSLPDQDSVYILKIIDAIHKDGAFSSIINDPSVMLSPVSSARIYQLSLCQSGMENVLKKIECNVFRSKSPQFVGTFLKSFTKVAHLLKQNRRKFIDRSKIFVQYYLLSMNSDMRDMFRDLVFALFPEYPRRPTLNNKSCSDMAALFNILIELLPVLEMQLYKASEKNYAEYDFETLCPTPHFFFIAHWLAINSNLRNEVALASKRLLLFLLNIKKTLSKANPRIDLLDFLSSTLREGLYETFFIQVKYGDFLSAFDDIEDSSFRSVDVAAEIAEITPIDSTNAFLSSKHGKRLMDYGFKAGKGPEIENFLSVRSQAVNWSFIRDKVWREYIIQSSMKTRNSELVRISGLILTNSTGSTLTFEKLNIHEKMLRCLLRIIREDPEDTDGFYTELCNCLVYFNRMYLKENIKKKTILGTSYMTRLCDRLIEAPIDFSVFVFQAFEHPTKAEPTLRLLDSISMLCEKISIHLLKIIPPDFLTAFKGDNLDFAINMISSCLGQITDSNYLSAFVEKQVRGIVETHQKAAERFLSTLSTLIEKEYNKAIILTVSGLCDLILSTADDPNVLTGTTLFIASIIYERGFNFATINIRKWVNHVYDLIAIWLKDLPGSLNKLYTIGTFIKSVKSTFSFTLPQIPLIQEDIDEAMKKLQDIGNETANDVISTLADLQA